MKKWFKKILAFFRKYGIDAVLALLIFNFPMYAITFIKAPGFITFATWWTAFWWGLGPLTPGWLATVLLAVFIRWLRLGAWAGVLWLKEALAKLQLQNQFIAYLTSEEINLILEVAKKIHLQSEAKKKAFADILKKERLQMIDDQWTKEVQDGKTETKKEKESSKTPTNGNEQTQNK